jgi:hypothetical protein
MEDRVKGCVTVGVALVGAGVMAAMPGTQQAPEVLRSVNAEVALADAPQHYNGTTAELIGTSAQRLAGSFISTPLGLIPIAQAAAAGQDATVNDLVGEYIDGPLYVADPTIYALDDLLPAPFGGDPNNYAGEPGTSLITQFRANTLIKARDDVAEAVADTLGVGPLNQPTGNQVSPIYAAARLAGGFGETAVRTAVSTATAPLGLVGVAQGLQTSLDGGGNTNLYLALQAYIDAPNYATDPLVFAVDDVLPAPNGGDPDNVPEGPNDSAVTQFRANVLLAPRDQVRGAVARALGVDPVTGADTTSGFLPLNGVAANVGDPSTGEASHRTGLVTNVAGSVGAPRGASAPSLKGGRHRAEPTGPVAVGLKKLSDQVKTAITPKKPASTD